MLPSSIISNKSSYRRFDQSISLYDRDYDCLLAKTHFVFAKTFVKWSNWTWNIFICKRLQIDYLFVSYTNMNFFFFIKRSLYFPIKQNYIRSSIYPFKTQCVHMDMCFSNNKQIYSYTRTVTHFLDCIVERVSLH